jgi:DNA polymerase III subunit gamma/tau
MWLVSEVLYRKWRPQSFSEVAGQDAITRTLRNSVAAGRLSHAYLFCGPRGTGKTTLGRLLAKAANCAAPVDGEPCNKCDSCLAFLEGRAMDFVEQDAASHNSVDDIRQLRENVILTPMAGERKVHLLDEVHMLSKAAQNALLKTLEEPPAHLIFVLATTEAHKVEPTIISRCQRFDLKRIPMSAVVARLDYICRQEGFDLDAASLEEISRAATGSLRDAINALEQVVTYYGKSPSHEQVCEALGLSVDARSGQLARAALNGDLAGGLTTIAEVRDDGVDIKQFAKQVIKYLRGLLLAKAGASESLDLPQDMAAEVKADATNLSKNEIIRALQTFGRIDFREDAAASGGSLPLELALVEFVSSGEVPPASAAAAPRPAVAQPPRRAEPPLPPPPPPKAEAPKTNGAAKPVPEPAPTRPAPPRSAPMKDGEPLSRVRELLHETDRPLEGMFNGACEIASISDDAVTIGFYHTFHLERMEKNVNKEREKLEKAFSMALGRPVKVKYQHSPQERPSAKGGGHLVQAARELGAKAEPPESEP